MKISKQQSKLIKQLVDLSFRDGKPVEPAVIKSIKFFKSQPYAILLLLEYLKQLKFRERQYTMFIETAFKLSVAQLKKVRKIVERKHKITKVLVSINPEIIGGFKLKIADQVWDESLLGKIHQIKEAIIHGRSN